MKLPKITKQQITLQADGHDQLRVEIYPKKKPTSMNGVDCSKIDIIRIVFKGIEGNEQDLYMTPDEALEVSAILTESVQTWLLACSKGYREEIANPRIGVARARIKAMKK